MHAYTMTTAAVYTSYNYSYCMLPPQSLCSPLTDYEMAKTNRITCCALIIADSNICSVSGTNTLIYTLHLLGQPCPLYRAINPSVFMT